METMEKSLAEQTRQLVEKQDEGLIDLILSGEPRQDACFELKTVHCPICQGNTIQITETAEGDSERVFFQMKCLDCGCEFVLFEDFIDACRRGVLNAKNEIEYNKNKIDYFEKKLRGGEND